MLSLNSFTKKTDINKPELKSFTDELAKAFNRSILEQIEKMKPKKLSIDGCLITINPPPKYDNVKFILPTINHILNFFPRKWTKCGALCVEQRATDDTYRGIHYHVVIEFNEYYRPSEVKRQFVRHFKKVKSPIYLEPMSVHVSSSKRGIAGCYDYIRGEKNDDSKKDKSDNDKRMREDLDLEDIYTF